MKQNDPANFHKLHGRRRPRLTYFKRDFVDYLLMVVLSGLVVIGSYGAKHLIGIAGLALCAFSLAMFAIRHGIEISVPVIWKRPLEVIYMLVYKVQNLRSVYFIALGLLLLENLAITKTPNLPHHVELIRKVAFYLFYLHLGAITAYRTAILIAHLRKRQLVREVLLQTSWRRVVKENTNITLEIVHAYCTGLLTHILLLAPWYLVIKYFNFSVIFLPIVCVIDVFVHLQWYKAFDPWFYRDHWLGHNSEFEFIFLHGTHHDAIPSGLVAVAENGFLEGVLRFTIGGFPTAFYNPLISFLLFTIEIKTDIDAHQYIPGIFPKMPRSVLENNQHVTHHYGALEPYSIGTRAEYFSITDVGLIRIASKFVPAASSIKLDEELTGFKWDNLNYRRILRTYDKYND